MDGENIHPTKRSRLRWPAEQACLSSGPLFPASLWSGLADRIVIIVAMIATRWWGDPPLFQISNWGARGLDGQSIIPRTSVSFFLFFFRLFALLIAGRILYKRKIQKYLPWKLTNVSVSFLYFCGPVQVADA